MSFLLFATQPDVGYFGADIDRIIVKKNIKAWNEYLKW